MAKEKIKLEYYVRKIDRASKVSLSLPEDYTFENQLDIIYITSYFTKLMEERRKENRSKKGRLEITFD